MLRRMKDYLKLMPPCYDLARRVQRRLGARGREYDLFDEFSRRRRGRVNFIQVGANDGLRNDPIREFVVRDRWSGLLIEPLPGVFEELKKNYRYLGTDRLIFVNAAVSDSTTDGLDFWSFDERFLGTLSTEERLDLLRKSSFDLEHLRRHYGDRPDFERIVEAVRVPCLTLTDLVEKSWPGGEIDLIVIDAEGHEPAVIRGIDFRVLAPRALFFESAHLGRALADVSEYLTQHDYRLITMGANTMALRAGEPDLLGRA